MHARNLLPRLVPTTAGALVFLAGLICRPAVAAPPHYADMLPLREVKPGMVGYGLTTFKGTTISRFKVTVIGILRKENVGHDLILIKMQGGPITERGANLIQGMSGSPIYLKGKIAGAFSMGEEFPKEPIGMVTPIDDMMEAWDPAVPQTPSYFVPAAPPRQPAISAPAAGYAQPAGSARVSAPRDQVAFANLATPLDLDGRHIRKVILDSRAHSPLQSTNSVAVLHPCTNLLMVSGLREPDRAWLQQALDSKGYHLTVAQDPSLGSSSGGHFGGAPLRPGSAFGTFLSTGDIDIGATGTVTYRRGERILGFGHPLFGLGALEAAVTSAYIVDVFSGLRTSHHIAIAGPVIGTLMQDRDFSVSGLLGRMPHLIPYTLTVRDDTTGRAKTFHCRLFQHPDLTPTLLQLVARDAISQIHDVPGDVMASVTTTVDAAEVGKIERRNEVYSASDISATATSDLTDITGVVSGNPFYALPIRSASVDVHITRGHNTASIERIFLKQGRYEAGEHLEVGVVLKPYRRDPIIRTIDIPIPADTPTGRYPLVVRGGTPTATRIGPFILLSQQQDPQAPPVNVRQMAQRLEEKEHTTDVVAHVMLSSTAPAVEGEKLSQLPPNLSALMRSDRNSGVRLERDELKGSQPTEYVISGTQQLVVNVVHREDQEPASAQTPTFRPAQGGSSPPIVLPPGLIAGAQSDENPSSQSASEEDSAESGQPLRHADHQAPGQPVVPPKKSAQKAKPGVQKQAQPAPAPATAAPATPAPAPEPATDAADRPVGRRPQTWRQTAARDFSGGKFAGTSVTPSGGLRIAPTLQRLATTPETYVWALEPDSQGNLYAATGTSGRLLKITPTGDVATVATLPVVSLQSMLRDKDGSFWVGSAVKGSVYHVTAAGNATLVCTLPEKYVLALAEDSKGNLYMGAGNGGTVYRLTVAEAAGASVAPVHATPFVKTSAERIMALAVDRHDNLYVGTGDEGVVYRVKPDGSSTALYDVRSSAITALATDASGNVYAGSGPRGGLYRIAPDGTVTSLYDRATSFYTALRTTPDGRLYAATVTGLYLVTPGSADGAVPTTILPFDNPRDIEILSLALLPDGTVAAGTGNIGELYVTGAASRSDGVYTSLVHDAGNTSRWGMARWEGTSPAGSQIRIETRTGAVGEPDSTWNPWAQLSGVSRDGSYGQIASPPGRFIQYRISLRSSAAGSPELRWVSLDYMPRNQPPMLTLQSPAGGEQWAGNQTLRWSASDPDNDTLTYALYLSSDGGTTWRSLAGGASRLDTGAKAPDALTDSHSAIPADVRQAIMDSLARHGETTNALRDTSKSWNTKDVSDGVYRIKVVATDLVSNPADPQTVEAISEPFLVCNATPQIIVGSPTVDATRRATVTGAATQAMLAVTAVQYRVDKGDWVAAVPRDGLFNSPREEFSFTTAPLSAGQHTVEIEAFNAAGTRTSQKVSVEAR